MYYYLEEYIAWKKLVSLPSPSEADRNQAAVHRANMKLVEDGVTDQHIISLRSIALEKIADDEALQEEADDIERKIQKELGERVGLGLWMWREEQEKIEAEIRAKYAGRQGLVEVKKRCHASMFNSKADAIRKNFDYTEHAAKFENEQKVLAEENENVTLARRPSGDHNQIEVDVEFGQLIFSMDNEFEN